MLQQEAPITLATDFKRKAVMPLRATTRDSSLAHASRTHRFVPRTELIAGLYKISLVDGTSGIILASSVDVGRTFAMPTQLQEKT